MKMSYFIMILHQLNDNPYVVGVVLYGDYPHDICGIFGIWILAVFIG